MGEVFVSDEEWRSVVRRALGSDGALERLEAKRPTAGAPPSGFMARHLGFVATVSVGGVARRVHFFAKAPPSSAEHQRLLEEMRHFEKELTMYESVVPLMFRALPPGVELPLPRAYLTRRDRPLIVMEDLKEQGYRLRDRMLPFDLAHCLCVLRSLARFHAGSLLAQEADRAPFLALPDTILADEDSGEMARRWAHSSASTIASAAAGLWPERFADRQRVEGRLRETWREMSRMARPSEDHVNVMCHGDLWPNNLMFRYGGGGEPMDAKLVDLQIVRFAQPATDILMLLHTSTTRAFRERQGRGLVLAYHRHLAEVVGEGPLRKVLPLEALLASVDEHAFFGKLLGAVWCSITLGSDEETGGEAEPVDFATTIMRDRGEKVLRDARQSDVFRERICECYEELLQQLGLWE